ncbi:MAG TPA: aldehyde dehydrogenase family protein [Nitrososphaerales archaeon]|nr:aldehyde dehydrogenase family protein [Nitrososphaerales archaeon]
MRERYGNLIGGREDFEGESVTLHSPADGSLITEVTHADRGKTEEAIDAAADAFKKWSRTSIRDRQELLLKLADRVQSRSDEYALIETLNTGKTIRQSTMMDVPLGIEHIRYFGATKEFPSTREIEHPEFPGTRGIIQYAPVGVVGAIAPWNLPFLMAVWKVAPALLAGNTVVLKPSHHTPMTALELAKDSLDVGFPPGVLNALTGKGTTVGQALVSSPKVSLVSFTGSTATGERLLSGSAGVKRFTLELGGKSPNIVFEDADLEKAVKGVLFGIFLNSGQLCESGSRLIVHSSIREKFLAKLKGVMEKMRAGNPFDMETDVSAITTEEQKKKIERMVEGGLGQGAHMYYQKPIAQAVPKGGLYYSPSLLTDVPESAEVAREEIFGPVLVTLEFDREEDAINLANATDYGLAAGVWSKDMQKAKRVASEIDAGTIWVNEYHLLSAAAPRGGFKKSGVGRELGLEGIMEFTQTRHIFVNEGADIDEVAYGLILPG